MVTHRGQNPYSLPFKGYCVVDTKTGLVVAGNEDGIDFGFNLADLVDYVAGLKKVG
jgi:hypothetical protein